MTSVDIITRNGFHHITAIPVTAIPTILHSNISNFIFPTSYIPEIQLFSTSYSITENEFGHPVRLGAAPGQVPPHEQKSHQILSRINTPGSGLHILFVLLKLALNVLEKSMCDFHGKTNTYKSNPPWGYFDHH